MARLTTGRQGRSFKQRVEESPLFVVVGVAASVGAAVAGVMSYSQAEYQKVAEARSGADLARAEQDGRMKLSEAQASLGGQIADLDRRLRSIELRLPDDASRTFFDITAVMIPEDRRTTLDAGFRKVAGGDAYVSVPAGPAWRETEESELEIVSGIFGDETKAQLAGTPVGRSLAASKVWAWTGPGEARVRLSTRDGDVVTATYRPMIYIERITPEYLKTRASSMSRTLDAGGPKAKEASDALDAALARPAPAEDAARTDEVLSVLEKLSQTDMASFLLSDTVTAGVGMATEFDGARYRVLSAQKKGNVLYLHQQLEFPAPPGEPLSVDQEFFFFGRGADGICVRTFVPQTDGAADAFAWIRAWLAGLRIVV